MKSTNKRTYSERRYHTYQTIIRRKATDGAHPNIANSYNGDTEKERKRDPRQRWLTLLLLQAALIAPFSKA